MEVTVALGNNGSLERTNDPLYFTGNVANTGMDKKKGASPNFASVIK